MPQVIDAHVQLEAIRCSPHLWRITHYQHTCGARDVTRRQILQIPYRPAAKGAKTGPIRSLIILNWLTKCSKEKYWHHSPHLQNVGRRKIWANSPPPTVILPSIDLHGFAAGKNMKGLILGDLFCQNLHSRRASRCGTHPPRWSCCTSRCFPERRGSAASMILYQHLSHCWNDSHVM